MSCECRDDEPFACEACHERARGEVLELLDLEEGLTEWEVSFVDSVHGKGALTRKMVAKIDQVWRERVG